MNTKIYIERLTIYSKTQKVIFNERNFNGYIIEKEDKWILVCEDKFINVFYKDIIGSLYYVLK